MNALRLRNTDGKTNLKSHDASKLSSKRKTSIERIVQINTSPDKSLTHSILFLTYGHRNMADMISE